jgi:hypothetical protein
MDHPSRPQTQSTPMISFDETAHTLCIVGESFPENSFTFYAPVLDWLKQYLKNSQVLVLDLAITYMNSSSTKCMLDLLDLMEDANARGVKVSIIWRFDRENPRSIELAEEFSEEVTFPFEIVAIS